MGTWNTKPFGNDAACDWLGTLERASDATVLEDALSHPSEDDVLVAAATVIEAARRQPLGKLPTEAKAWITEQGFVPSNDLVKKAIAALEVVRKKGDLREAWFEGADSNRWLKQVDTLLTGLREVLSQPLPVRLPKASPAPRRLDKLIEKVRPNEESPLRETLHKRLKAITDFEASVTGQIICQTPLMLLAQQGLLPEARQLVERGAKCSGASLAAACRYGHAEMAEWFLQQGVIASPTTLSCAVKSGNIQTIQVLVRHGANLDTSDTEAELSKRGLWHNTLLHIAVEANHPHVVEFLVKSGLSTESRDCSDATPLMIAANQTNGSINNNALEIVRVLLSLGANPNAKDEHGYAALDLVSESKSEVASLIKEFGGRLGKDILNEKT